MINATDMKNILVNNFNDIRIIAIQAFISSILEREKYNDTITPRYLIKDIHTGTYITSLEDFVSKIHQDYIKFYYYYGADRMGGDRVHPIYVTVDNFIVEYAAHAYPDIALTGTYGVGPWKISFLVSYLSDGDPDLPLKIFEVKLSKA